MVRLLRYRAVPRRANWSAYWWGHAGL